MNHVPCAIVLQTLSLVFKRPLVHVQHPLHCLDEETRFRAIEPVQGARITPNVGI